MQATNSVAVNRGQALALAAVGVVMSACGPKAATPPAPVAQFSLDDMVVPATVQLAGTRQQLQIEVTPTASASVFGHALGAIRATIDLTAVPDTDPGKYNIKLVAACSSTQETVVALGGAPLVELDGASQAKWSELSLDGCVLGSLLNGYRMTGQTNIDKLDATQVDAALFFALERGTEKHRFSTNYAVVKF